MLKTAQNEKWKRLKPDYSKSGRQLKKRFSQATVF